MTAEGAKAFGLVDEVVEKDHKPQHIETTNIRT